MKDNSAPPVEPAHNPQDRPVALSVREGVQTVVTVDIAARFGDSVVIVGWCTGLDADLSLWHDDVRLPSVTHRTLRPDVAAALGLSDSLRLGFVLLADANPAGASLVVAGPAVTYSFAMTLAPQLPEPAFGMIQSAVAAQVATLVTGTDRKSVV